MSFFVYRLANEMMSDVGFSEYNLARRSVSLFQPLLMIGLGVAVPRYISMFPLKKSFLMGAAILLGISAILLGSIFFLFDSYFAQLLLGDSSYSNYIMPLFSLLFGICFHALVFGYLRGKQYVYYPNILQFFNIGVLPIAVILYAKDVRAVLLINGLVLITTSLTLFLRIVLKNQTVYSKKEFIEDCKILLKYGLPRVLGDFSLLLLITAPAYLILYIQDDILISGDIAYSFTLLNLVGAAFGPLGMVMIPEIASLMSKGENKLIEQRFFVFLIIGLIATSFGFTIFYFFNDFILQIILGADYRPSIAHVSVIILKGSFGYALFIILRNFLDAIKVKAINSINLLVTLFVYGLLMLFAYYKQGQVEDYLNCFVISVSFLGLLTLAKTYYVIKKLP